MRILNLVLYSPSDIYTEMYKLLSGFYKKYNFVTTIFYHFDETIKESFKLENDILKIKGKETYLPGILDKTIKCFEWVKNNLVIEKYDYIVRTNISSVVEFNKFANILLNISFDYGSFCMFCLNHLDYPCGIFDNKYFGLKYASGTNIIMNNKLFNDIIDNKNKLDYTIIDDVSIGVLVRDHLENVKYCPDLSNFYLNTSGNNHNVNKYCNKYVVFRNNCGSRMIDIDIIKKLSLIL